MTPPVEMRITDPGAFVSVARDVADYYAARSYRNQNRPNLWLDPYGKLQVGYPFRGLLILGRFTYRAKSKTVVLSGPLLGNCEDELIDCFAAAGVKLIVRTT